MSSRRVGSKATSSSSRRVSEKRDFDEAATNTSKGFGNSRRRPNGRLLTILPFLFIPGVLRTFGQGDKFGEALAILLGMILLFGGAWLVRRGIQREANQEAQLAALPSIFPYKTAGAVAYGLGIAVAGAFVARYGPAMGILYGVVTAAAVIVRYGVDTKAEKSDALRKAELSGIDIADLLKKMAEAKRRVLAIRGHANHLSNRAYREQIGRIADSADAVIGQIERDPRDIRSARKFLISYLKRAEEVTQRFAHNEEVYATKGVKSATEDKGEIERKFAEALNDLETVFEQQNEKLLANDSLDLEVKLDVLSQRLRSEGAG